MKTEIQVLCASILIFSSSPTDADTINRVYLDRKNNVHVITEQGLHRQVTRHGNAIAPKVAPDNKTAAWLVANTWIAEALLHKWPGSSQVGARVN
ncbi:hypothetical protein [Herbaspirillum sp. SJZ107]|uniref:hypothetical protein n=1 Tax=Herbaspirillum sp. SJZ107 TaxID=2572881 RepID=UPI001151BE11|nr:hypothetical protein [Herbaspirillum sp. SJZ107]